MATLGLKGAVRISRSLISGMPCLFERLQQLEPGAFGVLMRCVEVAQAEGLELALVGGALRDLCRSTWHNHPWTGLPDLDLVVIDSLAQAEVVPPAHRLALALGRHSPLDRCVLHGAYGTAELQMDAVFLDLASARCEHYPLPGHNPIVELGDLHADLARRDFSINAMALVWGRPAPLLDPFGGIQALAEGRLSFLHERSLEDDPTRLVRAARYAARLGMDLDPPACAQVQRTVKRWPWRTAPDGRLPASLGVRLRMELELLLQAEPWRPALEHLQRWGGLMLLDSAVQERFGWSWALSRAERLQVPLLTVLVAAAADPIALAERLQLAHQEHRRLLALKSLQAWLQLESQEADPGWSASRWTCAIESLPHPELAVPLALCLGGGGLQPLLHWWWRWRHQRPELSASELIATGITPGPALGERLRDLRLKALDQRWPIRKR